VKTHGFEILRGEEQFSELAPCVVNFRRPPAVCWFGDWVDVGTRFADGVFQQVGLANDGVEPEPAGLELRDGADAGSGFHRFCG